MDVSHCVGNHLLSRLSCRRIRFAVLVRRDRLRRNGCSASSQQFLCLRSGHCCRASHCQPHSAARRDVYHNPVRRISNAALAALSRWPFPAVASSDSHGVLGQPALGICRRTRALHYVRCSGSFRPPILRSSRPRSRSIAKIVAMAGAHRGCDPYQSLGAMDLHRIISTTARAGPPQRMDC